MKPKRRFIKRSIPLLLIVLAVSAGIITTVMEAASTDHGRDRQDTAKVIFYVH